MERAIRLFHRRWSVPIVAVLHRDGPLRFNELASRIAASRDTLSETLADLVSNGVVHHRWREGTATYGLSAVGKLLGPVTIEMTAAVTGAGLVQVATKKWPMLVLAAVGNGEPRYGEIVVALPGITTRSLSMALKDLELEELVVRTSIVGYPRTTAYRATERAQQLLPTLLRLIEVTERLPG